MKKIIIFSATIIFFLGLPFMVFAQTGLAPATISISAALPGALPSSTGPCGWAESFYNFALIAAGILAFGSIVWGGVLYATSAGNASKQSEGRSWIWSALIGLLLLAGAYVVLYTINPGLTKCSLPTLSSINIAAPATTAGTTGTGTGTTVGQPTGANCASGQCETIPNCTPSANVNCGGAQGLLNTLTCINNADPGGFTVTEGYPPTDLNPAHLVGGHSTGCSADVVVSSGGAGTCANVANLISAEQQCGVSNIVNNNEYYTCPGGNRYGQTTGQNVHVNAQPGQGGC